MKAATVMSEDFCHVSPLLGSQCVIQMCLAELLQC